MSSIKQYFEKMIRTKKAKNRLKTVLNLFPEIENEIEIIYDHNDLNKICSCNPDPSVDGDKVRYGKPEVTVGHVFFIYPKKEQEAIVAHELSHVKRYLTKVKSKTFLLRRASWKSEFYYGAGVLFEGFSKENFSSTFVPPKHTRKRVETWRLAEELNADNQVVEKGLGHYLLQSCIRTDKELPRFGIKLKELGKKEFDERIKNLEAKLENG